MKKGLVVLFVLAAAGLLSLLAYGLVTMTPPTTYSGMTRVDKPAQPFTIPLYNGGQISLADLKGKVVVINFWASWCIPCRQEAAALEQTWQAYRDKGVVFIGVNIQDKEADARAFIQEFKITYANGPDVTGEVSIDWGVSGIPTTFFVSKEGRVAGRWVGPVNEKLLVEYIDFLLRQ